MNKYFYPSGTREWAEETVNIQKGCVNDCKYCYSKAFYIEKRIIEPREWKIPQTFPTKINKFNSSHKIVMYPGSHDIQIFGMDSHISIIERILKKKNRLLLVSKPRMNAIEILCDKFDIYFDQITFRFTIGSADNDVLKFWEPGDSSYDERMECLKYVYKRGFNCGISSEPMLDMNPELIYENAKEFINDEIWFGTMNDVENRLSFNCPEDEEALARAKELTRAHDKQFLQNLHNMYKDDPKVKMKNAVKQILGLPPEQLRPDDSDLFLDFY